MSNHHDKSTAAPGPSEPAQPDWDTVTAPYESLQAAMCRVVIGAGALIASYGPYTPIEAARIMKRCSFENIPAFVRFECSHEFDWQFARDMRALQAAWGKGGQPLANPSAGDETAPP